MAASIEERKANTPAGAAKRAALVEAMELKNYEFNAHGVELGQFYASDRGASPTAPPRPEPDRDPELYYQPSTVPGSRLPHAWVGDNQAQAVDARPGADDPVHPDHRHRRGGVGRPRPRRSRATSGFRSRPW